MPRRAKKGSAQDLQEVQARFLASVEDLARSPDELVAAVNFGLERAFDQLLRQACAELGASAEDFAAALEADPARQADLQARIARLFTPEAIETAKGEAQRKDAERHLHVLRYVLGGAEPAAWVWQSMDSEEEERLRAFRRAGGEDDPALRQRVERALEKVGAPGFGRCEGCQGPIAPERLGLVPWAERCTVCQLNLERTGAEEGGPRVPMMMFFEGGKPVPPDKRLIA